MSRKKKMIGAISLKAQEHAHKKIADDPGVNVGDHTREYWKKEANGYGRQAAEKIEKAMFTQREIEEIDRKGKEEAERLYQKKKEKIGKQEEKT
jgi:hypothetical protein